MQKVLERIQKGDFPNRLTLSQELEVTEKTIQRDINFLRDSLEMAIEWSISKRGYHLTGPVKNFPLVHLSQKELVAVFVAQKAITQYAGTPFEQPLRTAFDKLTAGLDGEMAFAWSELQNSIVFKNIEATTASLELFQTLNLAIHEKKEVQFEYRKLDATGYEIRHVRPLQLGCINHQWYLFSYCNKRKAIRTFALTRMRRFKTLSTTFSEPKNFSVADHLKNSFGVFAGQAAKRVVIKFDRFASQLIQERNWHPSQKLKELHDGRSEVSFTLSALEEIESWILSWGTHAKVIAPKDLAERIKEKLKKTLAQY